MLGSGGKHFVSGNRLFFLFLGDEKETAKLLLSGGGACSAPFGVAMSSKRWVHATHGPARGQNPLVVSYNLVFYTFLSQFSVTTQD